MARTPGESVDPNYAAEADENRDRVICVVTTGQAWQFRPYKWQDPKVLFRNREYSSEWYSFKGLHALD